jgi:hypothetical protein
MKVTLTTSSNQPNTEDGNELDITLDIIMPRVGEIDGLTGEIRIQAIETAKQQIISYIQSNYILKSDVEKFIDENYIYSMDEYGNFQYDPSGNQLLDDLRNRLKESNK